MVNLDSAANDPSRQWGQQPMNARHQRELQFYARQLTKVQMFPADPSSLDTAALLMPKDDVKGLLFFLHGAGNDLFFPHRLLFGHFLAAGYGVYTCNLPGHGPDDYSILDDTTLDERLLQQWGRARSVLPDIPMHVVAYSLGGLSILTSAKLMAQIDQSATVSLIGVPARFDGVTFRHTWEMTSIYRLAFWAHHFTYGPRDFLPALGPLRRRSFPIRIDAPGTSYIDHLVHLWQRRLRQSNFSPSRTVQTIWGGGDQFARYQDAMHWNRLGIPLKAERIPGQTHFTLLLCRETFRRIERWISA